MTKLIPGKRYWCNDRLGVVEAITDDTYWYVSRETKVDGNPFLVGILTDVYYLGRWSASLNDIDANPYNPYEVDETAKMIEYRTNPKHYDNGKIQVWDFILDKNMNFLEGNIIKYLCRHRMKNGKEDLLKAIKYLEKLIETEYKS